MFSCLYFCHLLHYCLFFSFFALTLVLFGGKVLSLYVCLCVLAGEAPPTYGADGSLPRAHLGSWPADATCQAHGIIAFFHSLHNLESLPAAQLL